MEPNIRVKENVSIPLFKTRLLEVEPRSINFERLKVIQLNLGNLCNQRCIHCHVKASSEGTRLMDKSVIDKVIAFLSEHRGLTLDMTGGCPELNPHLRYLIDSTDGLCGASIVRTNLTILTEPEMNWLPQFYKDHGVSIVASLPCYTEENVDKQRGSGVFSQSIKALKLLNDIGYSRSLDLNLVYNPGGEFLPGEQQLLESDYRERLFEQFGITFNSLFTITNVPVGRFGDYLRARGIHETYLGLLAANFNPDTAENIMCRTLISVDWQGYLYNCDFNQAAGLPIRDKGRIADIDDLGRVMKGNLEIQLAQHCYACTAGQGSSCGGALA